MCNAHLEKLQAGCIASLRVAMWASTRKKQQMEARVGIP